MLETSFVADPGKQEVVIRRVFEAPRDLVFKTYLDAKLVPEWWGPGRLRTVVESMEARPGGFWRLVQRDEAGNEFAFRGVFHSVVPPERFVRTFEFEGLPGRVSLQAVTFEEPDGKTKQIDQIVFQTLEDRDRMLAWEMESGMRESMERLADLLQRIQNRMAA